MVKMLMTRSHSGGPSEICSDREVPLAKAIQTIIEFELGYGGHIVRVDQERMSVSTATVIFNCRDMTTVTCKTKEEFITLLQACHAHHEVFGIKTPEDLDRASKVVLDITKGNALMVTHFSGPLMGGVLTHKKTLNRIIASFGMVAAGMEEKEVVELLSASSDDEIQQWIEAACAA